MQWYYARGNESVGPLDADQFRNVIQTGVVTPETLVWREGFEEWTAYGNISGATTSEPVRPKLRLAKKDDRPGIYVSPEDKAAAEAEAETTGEAAATEPVVFFAYGGFWIRFVAKLIDSLILGVVSFGLGIAMAAALVGAAASDTPHAAVIVQIAGQGIQFLIYLIYHIFFIGKFAATPGKMILKLKVVRPDGTRVGYGRACGRYFAELLSALIFSIGYIMAAFDDEKRSLHDRICDTRVVRA